MSLLTYASPDSSIYLRSTSVGVPVIAFIGLNLHDCFHCAGFRYLCALGAALNITALMAANLAGFVLGLDGLKGGQGWQCLQCGAAKHPCSLCMLVPVVPSDAFRTGPSYGPEPRICYGHAYHLLFSSQCHVLVARRLKYA